MNTVGPAARDGLTVTAKNSNIVPKVNKVLLRLFIDFLSFD
jgi:hypothetical protein